MCKCVCYCHKGIWIYMTLSYCYPSRRWLEEAGQPGVCTAVLETFPSALWLVHFSLLTTRGTLWNRIGPSIKIFLKRLEATGEILKKQFSVFSCVCLTWLTNDDVIRHGRAMLVPGDALIHALVRLCLLSTDVNDQSAWAGLHNNFRILFHIEMSAVACPWKARVTTENPLRQHSHSGVTISCFL